MNKYLNFAISLVIVAGLFLVFHGIGMAIWGEIPAEPSRKPEVVITSPPLTYNNTNNTGIGFGIYSSGAYYGIIVEGEEIIRLYDSGKITGSDGRHIGWLNKIETKLLIKAWGR